MSAQREILFLAHRIPYPPDKGDKIRSWRLVEHLAQRFRVHLAAFVDDPADLAHEAHLQKVCETVRLVPLKKIAARVGAGLSLLGAEPFSFGYYRDVRMARHVREVRRRTLAAEFAFSSSAAPYIAAPAGGRPRFVDLCDADSEKWRAYSLNGTNPLSRRLYAREADRLARAETDILNWAEATFAVSEAEAAILNARPGVERAARVLRNGVDAAYFAPAAAPLADGCAADVVFVGAMDYAANVDAVLWFVRAVWPGVRERLPSARFAIVGSNPAAPVRALDGIAGVCVTGRVDDVRPYLQQARVVAAPLRVARGVQNKVLEAMATARPIVATSAANAGVGAVDGREIIIRDDPAEFAQEVCRLIAEPAAGQTLGAAARARILRDFEWSAQLAVLDRTLEAFGVL